MARLPGGATKEGTREFADRAVHQRSLSPGHFRPAPRDLTLSSIGLGTYIGAPDAATDAAVEQATTICLSSGRVNVLDTAINYRHQRAERSVGRAIRRLVDKGSLQRKEVFVATKVGYLAPDGESSLAPARWIEQELVKPGTLRREDIVDDSHAMSVPYLGDQFHRSRENLGLDTVDLLYLHNAPDAQIPAVGSDAFLVRLEAAFAWAEKMRDGHSLGSYGLATWDSLRSADGDPGHFELEPAVRLATKVGGKNHGFRFVQFPFNLAMNEAATARTQTVGGSRVTLFDALGRLGLAAFTSVPLVQGQLARTGPARDPLSAAQTAIQFARSAPGNVAPLVGQKSAEHLSENLELASHAPWDTATFRSMLS